MFIKLFKYNWLSIFGINIEYIFLTATYIRLYSRIAKKKVLRLDLYRIVVFGINSFSKKLQISQKKEEAVNRKFT